MERTKKLRLLILSFLIINSSLLISQNTWIQTYTPFYADGYGVEDVILCSDGGYAINGYYYVIDPFGGYEEWWGFLLKTDSDGNLIWERSDIIDFQIENESNAFVETSDDGFISAVSGGNLIKRDANGNRDWVIEGDFGINSMCNTTDGNIILGGAQDLNIGLRKIDEEGNTIWDQIYPIEDSWTICKSIIQTSDGGYALTGYIDYFEPMGEGDVFIMKTDAYGDSLWTKKINGYNGTGERDQGRSIIENTEGDFFVSGYFESSNRTYYGFLMKLSSDGEIIYVLTDDNSNSYYGCNSMAETIIDNKIVCYGRDEDGPALNAFNYNGDSLWVSSISGWGGAGDRCLQKINEGFVYCGKNYQYDISLTKTNAFGQVTSIDDEIIALNDYKLFNYPNPFNPSTTISFLTKNQTENAQIEIFNIKGQKIKTLTNENYDKGNHSVTWNGVDESNNPVSSGIYYYKLQVNGRTEAIRKCLLLK